MVRLVTDMPPDTNFPFITECAKCTFYGAGKREQCRLHANGGRHVPGHIFCDIQPGGYFVLENKDEKVN